MSYKVSWSDLKNFLDTRKIPCQYLESNNKYIIVGIDGPFSFECVLSKSPSDTTELDDFETNYKPLGNKSPNISYPFAQKKHYDGRKLTRRVHGIKLSLDTSGTEQTLTWTIPHAACLMTATAIINAIPGDQCDFSVLDTTTGTLTTIPNYNLNKFGVGVYPAKDQYHEISEYDAELFAGLQLEIKYTPVDSTARDVFFNITLHELT